MARIFNKFALSQTSNLVDFKVLQMSKILAYMEPLHRHQVLLMGNIFGKNDKKNMLRHL